MSTAVDHRSTRDLCSTWWYCSRGTGTAVLRSRYRYSCTSQVPVQLYCTQVPVQLYCTQVPVQLYYRYAAVLRRRLHAVQLYVHVLMDILEYYSKRKVGRYTQVHVHVGTCT